MLFRKFNDFGINAAVNTEMNIALKIKLNKNIFYDNSTLMEAYN